MTPSSPPASIRCHLTATSGPDGVDVRANDEAAPGAWEYAFYLYRGRDKLATRWYETDRTAHFDQGAATAGCSVTVFRRPHGGGEAVRLGSVPVSLEAGARARPAAATRRFAFPPVTEVHGVEGLRAAWRPDEPQRLDVRQGGFTYPLFRAPAKGDRLFVVLGGAVPDRATITLPRFNRFSWAEDFPGTLMCAADPTLTLSPSLRLGWYVGSADDDATDGLARLIEAASGLLGVPLDRVVTYGSSGGGFAALQIAARLGRGVTAIAINAQTQVLDYSVQRSVRDFLQASLQGMTPDAARHRFGARLSAVEAWRLPQAQGARALLVQNTGDPHHLERHFGPFCEALGVPENGTTADGRLGSLLYSQPGGHAAEPRTMLPRLLQRVDQLGTPGLPAAATQSQTTPAAPVGTTTAPVLLHIGLPKTGTTYLQRTFHTAWSADPEAPIDYPDAGFYNHQVALYEPLARFLPWAAKPGLPERWQALQAAIAHGRGELPTLLSAEALAALSDEGVRAFAGLLSGRPVARIVITVRPLAALLPSHWQQNMKQGGRGDLSAYAERMLGLIERGESPAQMFSYRHTVQAWRRVFPQAHITVIVMDGSHTQNLLGFARVCGLGAAHDGRLLASVPTASEQNLSFSVQECRELLDINERIARGQLPLAARREAMDRFFLAREDGAPYERPTLSPRHRALAEAVDHQSLQWLQGQLGCELVHGRDAPAVMPAASPAPAP